MTRIAPRLLLPALAFLGALQTSPPIAAATPSTCDVVGTVRDAEAEPVAGLDVRLELGPAGKAEPKPRHTTTDAEGRFRFAGVAEPADVVAALREGGEHPRFFLVEGEDPVELRASVDPAKGCELTLGPDSPRPFAADLLALYQGLRRGFALFERLGLRSGPPLRVEVNDTVANPDAAYWVGTSSFNPRDVQPPRLILGTAATLRSDPGAPDDREYHELGHHALATAFGALPRARSHVEGGGYALDPSSAAAWTEGFAIFFAALVAREIEQRPDAGRHRVEGAWLDLELDYRPWDLRGTDAIAVASLLWDMVDADREDRPAALELGEPTILTNAGVPHLLVARVHNPSTTAIANAHVRVAGPGFSGTAPVAPAVLPPDAHGFIALPLPAAVAERSDAVAAVQLHALATPGAKDDDLVHVELPALWTAIVELRGVHPDANGHLFDVSDLYNALRGRLPAQDRDHDGVDDIDALFIAHGLHADLDGDREHDPGEALGLTSHPGRTLVVDGQPQTWPDLLPRHRLALPPVLRMQVKVEPADATLAVLVSGSAWGGYLVTPDADGFIRVLPPPAREGATVSLVAMAPEHRPIVLWHQDAATLAAELEQHRVPYLHAGARLPAASEAEAEAEAAVAGSPRWPPLAFVGGCIAVLSGLLLMAIGWPRLR
jgi:hypothetical protein